MLHQEKNQQSQRVLVFLLYPDTTFDTVLILFHAYTVIPDNGNTRSTFQVTGSNPVTSTTVKARRIKVLRAQRINKVAVATLLSFSLATLQNGDAILRPFARAKKEFLQNSLANHRTCRWFAI